MSTQLNKDLVQEPVDRPQEERRGRIIAGISLVTIGLLTLVMQFGETMNLGQYFLNAVGLIFLIWGLTTDTFGLLIPGGILSGIGLGAYLVSGPFSSLEGQATAAVFLFSFAAGWALITLLSGFTQEGFQVWPLIPGGIMAAIGGALLAGGLALEVLSWLGRGWPLGLVIAGLWLILRRNQ